MAAMFADLIHRLRPQAAFLTYIQDHTDGIMSESNTAVGRALPLWPYSASDNVNRARSSEPDKMAFNLCMSFVDYPWRFVTVPPAEIQLRLHQSLAHGGALALNMHGTLDQEDQQALLAGRPIFQWHARHEDLYVDQQNAARVLLLRGDTPGLLQLQAIQSRHGHIQHQATGQLWVVMIEKLLGRRGGDRVQFF